MSGQGQAAAEGEVLAAVDLGSNSFHMVVARLSHGQLTVIDRLREMVQLAAGLDSDNHLDAASQRRAQECLSRFGERICDMHASRVRVVGTNTLRRVRDAGAFFIEAKEQLGHPIEVISGIEEARLIYIGAQHDLPFISGAQLVLDIGGGSTEVVRGEGSEPRVMESLYLGCVSLSGTFFKNGKLTAKRFERARLAARLEFQPLQQRFRSPQPVRAVGTSGTIRRVFKLLSQRQDVSEGVTRAAVDGLIAEMIAAGHLDGMDLGDMSATRRNVFPGGVAILSEAMHALDIERMVLSEGSLREGILHDMVGRLTERDARQRTVASMQARFHVDIEQAGRVEKTALEALEQVAESFSLNRSIDRLMLRWAASLHEIGLDIAHSRYQLHGAYLIEHADMPGFTTPEQQVLSRIVANHRRSIDRKAFTALSGSWQRRALRLTLLLRLAVLLHRSRRADLQLPPFGYQAKGRRLTMTIDGEWLSANPLTLAGLEREQKFLSDAGISLTLEIVEAD